MHVNEACSGGVHGERAAGTPRSCSLNAGSAERELLVRLETPPGAKLRERQCPEPLSLFTLRGEPLSL